MSEYIITTKQIEELNKANCGMQIVTSWLSAYAIFDTSEFPPLMKSEHLAITLPNIIRCRDCKHRAGANVQAVVSDLCMWLDIIVKPDGFCADGERS